MKLTKEDIQFVDNYLKKNKVKYLDIRVELIDHLASEIEQNNEISSIENYLVSKQNFIKEFLRKQQKSIHWSYQNKLWFQFFKFFYKPKELLLALAIGFVVWLLASNFDKDKLFTIFYFTLVGIIVYSIFYQIRDRKIQKNVQSLQSLFGITSLPSLFLYTISPVKDFLLENSMTMFCYFGFSILLAISAILVIHKERKIIIEKYYQLVKLS